VHYHVHVRAPAPDGAPSADLEPVCRCDTRKPGRHGRQDRVRTSSESALDILPKRAPAGTLIRAPSLSFTVNNAARCVWLEAHDVALVITVKAEVASRTPFRTTSDRWSSEFVDQPD
jgi:hypothetical protein